MLTQLLCQTKLIPPELESMYDEFQSQRRNPKEVFFGQQLLSLLSAFTSIHLFFDALDKCSDKNVDDIIGIICHYRHNGMKVFCTTRQHLIPRLNASLESLALISVDTHEDDLRNFLTVRLEKDWRHCFCPFAPVMDHLAMQAQGK
jgi:hypothetical protein